MHLLSKHRNLEKTILVLNSKIIEDCWDRTFFFIFLGLHSWESTSLLCTMGKHQRATLTSRSWKAQPYKAIAWEEKKVVESANIMIRGDKADKPVRGLGQNNIRKLPDLPIYPFIYRWQSQKASFPIVLKRARPTEDRNEKLGLRSAIPPPQVPAQTVEGVEE